MFKLKLSEFQYLSMLSKCTCILLPSRVLVIPLSLFQHRIVLFHLIDTPIKMGPKTRLICLFFTFLICFTANIIIFDICGDIIPCPHFTLDTIKNKSNLHSLVLTIYLGNLTRHTGQ